MIKMVVFDMAGTTVDEENIVYKTLQKALQAAGFKVSLEDVLRTGAGKEKLSAIKDLMKSKGEDLNFDKTAQAIYADFLSTLHNAYHKLDVKTFEGTDGVFDQLKNKGIKVVLNTGYDRTTAISLLEKLQWEEGEHFDLLVTADEVENGRPAPDMIVYAMKQLDINDPAQIAKVGDSVVDIQEGKAANCAYTFGITTGAQTKEQLSEAYPDYVIDSLAEILEVV